MAKQCENKARNLEFCNCTYEPCPRKGLCCECIQYHMKNNEMPACFFPKNVEATYDRSIRRFVSLHK